MGETEEERVNKEGESVRENRKRSLSSRSIVEIFLGTVICHQDNIYLLGCRPGEDAKSIISPKEQLHAKLSFFLDPASKFKDPG